MLHKLRPTGELKKMFDGPDAFNATTKRQSFYEAYDSDEGLDEGKSAVSQEIHEKAEHAQLQEHFPEK